MVKVLNLIFVSTSYELNIQLQLCRSQNRSIIFFNFIQCFLYVLRIQLWNIQLENFFSHFFCLKYLSPYTLYTTICEVLNLFYGPFEIVSNFVATVFSFVSIILKTGSLELRLYNWKKNNLKFRD